MVGNGRFPTRSPTDGCQGRAAPEFVPSSRARCFVPITWQGGGVGQQYRDSVMAGITFTNLGKTNIFILASTPASL